MSSLEDLLKEKLGMLDGAMGNDGPAIATGNTALQQPPKPPAERLTPAGGNDEQDALINQMLQQRAMASQPQPPPLTQQFNPGARFQKLQKSLAPAQVPIAPQAPIELSEDPEEMKRQIAMARQGQ